MALVSHVRWSSISKVRAITVRTAVTPSGKEGRGWLIDSRVFTFFCTVSWRRVFRQDTAVDSRRNTGDRKLGRQNINDLFVGWLVA